jgi:hypothetical protein
MSFFDEVTMKDVGPKTMTEKFNLLGQQTFANNYAKGGMSSYMFSPGGRRPGGLFFGSAKEGGFRHLRRLEKMKRSGLYNPQKIQGIIDSYSAKTIGRSANTEPGIFNKIGNSVGGKAFKAASSTPGMMLISGVASAVTTEGSAGDKFTAGTASAASIIGWEAGSKVGLAAGAAIGSVVPVVGTAIGAVAGYLIGGISGAFAAEEGVHGVKGYMDKNVDAARRQKYASGWYGDTSAFNTQKASTMRQMSLQMMNSGMMSARSGLGHEGLQLHQ